MKLSTFFIGVIFAFSGMSYAQMLDVDAFIRDFATPTYDCPAPAVKQQVAENLARSAISVAQRHALTSMQTHSQICDGNNASAEKALVELVNSPEINKNSKHYAAAVYQLAFIYDVQTAPQRCDFYTQAQSLAQGRFSDIYLSATLGIITECEPDTGDGVKLGQLFTLLEQYSVVNEPGAVAHIHNNIGLLFGTLGQHVLAAEQYLKAHRIGLDIYTGSNRLSILISAITSFMASGNFDKAEETIEEFRRINQDINLPLTNFWQLFAEAGFYYRTEQYDKLRLSLAQWDAMKDQINSVTYSNLFEWYGAVLCLAEQNAACLEAFLEHEAQTSEGYKVSVRLNKDYLRFITQVHFFLGNQEKAEQAFNLFADALFEDIRNDQASGRILGIANLYSQINSLENKLAKEQQSRDRQLFISGAVILAFTLLFAFYIRKGRLATEAIDPVTKLLNNRTALRRIAAIDSPSQGKTNALAIFDLGNFREVNRMVGSTKGDFVLQQIAATLQDVTRSTDVLGRFAPEQFILCLTDIEEETAKAFFDRVKSALENTALGDGIDSDINVRSSMSIYISSGKFGDLKEVLDDMLRSLSI